MARVASDITECQQIEEPQRLHEVLKMQVQQMAIAREQEKAALERAAELAKANEALKRSLDSLATEPNLDKFLGQVLTVIATQFQSPLTEYWYHAEDNIVYINMMCWQGHVYNQEEITAQFPNHPGVGGFHVLPLIHGESLYHRKRHFIIEDWHTHPSINAELWGEEWEKVFGVIEKEINVPMVLGNDCIGALSIRLPRDLHFTTQQIELAQAITHQATLAVRLTQLAEEAKQAAIARQKQAAQERAAELAKANEVLQAEIAERQRAKQVSRGQTEALVKTLTVLAAEPVLDNFLGYVLQAIAQQLGETSGGIWLYDEAYDTTILHIDYEDGQIRRGAEISRPGASRQNVLRQWDADYMQLLQEKKVLIQNVQDLPQTSAYAQSRSYNQQRGIKTILVVCLFFGEKFLGNITVLRSKTQRDYKPEELELACVLAYQASLAIQLTRLAEQTQQSAVLQERNRIAREIHDTLAQVLTGIVVQLQAAEDVYTTDPSDRQAHIATARQLAKQGLTEARRSVQALRPQALEGKNLTGALANLIEQMATGTGLETGCRV